MKSENKMDLAIRLLEFISEENKIENAQNYAKSCKELLMEFLVDNTPKQKSSYNLIDYAAKKGGYRPVLEGICYDSKNKTAVATDAMLLVVDRAKYDQDIVDKYKDQLDCNGTVTLDKYGNVISGVYPRYDRVFPAYNESNSSNIHIDVENVQEYIRKCKAYMKMYGCRKADFTCFFKVSDGVRSCWFNANLLLSFLIATDGNITISSEAKPGMYKGEKRDAVIMNVILDFDSEKFMGREEGLVIRY